MYEILSQDCASAHVRKNHMREDPYLDWLKVNLQAPGMSQSGLARHLGIDPSSVNRMVAGKRRLQTAEVPKAAEYFGVPAPSSEIIPSQSPLRMATVIGTVEAGHFLEVDELVEFGERVQIPVTVDDRFPNARMLLFDVSGDSMNALRPRPILPGDRIAAVAYEDVSHIAPVRDGSVVVVQRTRDGGHLREWSVKQVELHDDRIEFHPRSSDARHKAIIVPRDLKADDGVTVEIIAIVRRVLNEIPFA